MDTEQQVQQSLVKESQAVLLFDGVCNFCDYTVQFVIKHNEAETIHFAPLQSEFGQRYLQKAGLPADELKSLIFIENGQLFTRSTGALKMAKYLNSPWKWGRIFLIVPQPIRDFCYNIFAKNRYKWFGEKDACMIPSKEIRSRFIEF